MEILKVTYKKRVFNYVGKETIIIKMGDYNDVSTITNSLKKPNNTLYKVKDIRTNKKHGSLDLPWNCN